MGCSAAFRVSFVLAVERGDIAVSFQARISEDVVVRLYNPSLHRLNIDTSTVRPVITMTAH